MKTIADDHERTIILLVNDYNVEFEVATKKLSEEINRPLSGIVLVDQRIQAKNLHKPVAEKSIFTEVICDYSSPSSLIQALHPLENKLLAVNASSERNQPYYRILIPYLRQIATPTESSIVWSTQKDLMRQLLQSYSENISPSTQLINHTNAERTLESFRDVTYPLISKPAGLAASILVKRADSFEELTKNVSDSFAELDRVYTRLRGRGKPKLLIEEFMQGDMFSVDAYINNEGKTWILPPVKVTTAASIGLEGYYSYSISSDHGLNGSQIESLNVVAAQSMHALGLRNSVAHIELFDTPNGWKIIELGPRAGGYRQDMYLITYGIDHAYNELLLKTGFDPQINAVPLQSSAVLNLYAENEGIIKEIQGFDIARDFKGVHRLSLHAKIGDAAIFCGNGGNFIVDGVVFGASKYETDELMNRIRATIKIIVE